jgi:hypothetical protein
MRNKLYACSIYFPCIFRFPLFCVCFGESTPVAFFFLVYLLVFWINCYQFVGVGRVKNLYLIFSLCGCIWTISLHSKRFTTPLEVLWMFFHISNYSSVIWLSSFFFEVCVWFSTVGNIFGAVGNLDFYGQQTFHLITLPPFEVSMRRCGAARYLDS